MANIQTRRAVEGIVSYPLGDSPEEIKEKFHLRTVRKMSDNENVYGCSNRVKGAIAQNLNQLSLYPDGTTGRLIKKLSSFYQLEQEQFLIGNGSEEIIRLLARAYINPGDEAIMASMTFPRYETNVVIEGGTVSTVPMVNGTHDLANMYDMITEKTKMIFICNPNNPTGTIVGKEELLRFIKNIPPHILIILDEAYYEYVSSNDYLESIPLLSNYSNLVILRTFSKIYGLASLRIGYGIMHPSIAKELYKVKEVFNVNQLAQVAAEIALEDQEFIKGCAEKNEMERTLVCEQLQELGLGYFPSETNFVYVYTQQPVSAKLITNGIVVRKMNLTGYADAFRITLGTREDNKFFIETLKEEIGREKAV